MSVQERAQRDLERGDHWLARRRLASHLAAHGYDPQLLIRLGEISLDMHDAYEAGRMWLLSPAEGEDVERAIGVFLAHAGSAPQQVAAQLPRAVRLPSADAYPPVVRRRLSRLGLTEAVLASTPRQPPPQPPRKWIARVAAGAFLLLVAFLIASCTVGVGHIYSWLVDTL